MAGPVCRSHLVSADSDFVVRADDLITHEVKPEHLSAEVVASEDVVEPRFVRPLDRLVARRQQRPVLRLQQRLRKEPSLVAQQLSKLAEAVVRIRSLFLQYLKHFRAIRPNC